ncbi:hypothetical protein [Chromohalobacter sp. HP20-39]|uniref:hypothetical protein n=1 Tax=Chromohalobacter sp. HP20-39 TaxID=3079306 RepID=UPI00294B0DB2|nr:hypothetical protein [Chromohalobacter sp. HP20-39]MDV6318781.1 hypothetical protein [Chromohalobacter sp. HP20-39]
MKLTPYELGRKRPTDALKQAPRIADQTWRRELLEQARKILGSYTAIAEKAAVPSSSISRWKSGNRPIPDRYIPLLIEVVEGP